MIYRDCDLASPRPRLCPVGKDGGWGPVSSQRADQRKAAKRQNGSHLCSTAETSSPMWLGKDSASFSVP